jgi:hypothetical protein
LPDVVSRNRKSVEDVGHRLLAMRTAGLGGEDPAGLAVLAGKPDEKYGKPLRDPAVGPDGVPVVVRLRAPDGADLDWGSKALDGGLVGLVFVMLIGLGARVSAIVRR